MPLQTLTNIYYIGISSYWLAITDDICTVYLFKVEHSPPSDILTNFGHTESLEKQISQNTSLFFYDYQYFHGA